MYILNSLKKVQVAESRKNKDNFSNTFLLINYHFELFLGTIRSKEGFSNKPTECQFETAYKRFLVHSQIRAPKTGNAVNLEYVSILIFTISLTTNNDGLDI